MIQQNFDPSKLTLRGIVSSDHKRIQQFRCSNGSMDSFLATEAYIAHLMREASTTVLLNKDEIVAYFTLCHSSINLCLDRENKSFDALELARLAVDERYQGKGIGTYIIDYIKQIAYTTNERFIKTDAIFEKWTWYQRRGFTYVIEDEINPEKNSVFVYMIMDLLDEELVDKYFDE